MDKLFKSGALLSFLLGISQPVFSQSDSVYVSVKDFLVTSSGKVTMSGSTFKDIVAFGLAKDSTLIVNRNEKQNANNNNAKSSQVGYTVSGTASLYPDEFYCEIELRDKRNNVVKLPAVYGRNKDFYSAFDQLSLDLLEAIQRMRTPKNKINKIAIMLSIDGESKNETIGHSIAKSVYNFYVKSVSANPNFSIQDMAGANKSVADFNFDTLLCVVECRVAFDYKYNVKATSVMHFPNNLKLDLPGVIVSGASDYTAIQEMLQIDIDNLLRYVMDDAQAWNWPAIKILDSLSTLTEPLLVSNTTKSLSDNAEMPGMYLALKAVDRYPDSYEARMLAGKLRLKYSRLREAADQFSMALGRKPESPEAVMYLGHVYYMMNLFPKSIVTYKTLLTNPQVDYYFPNLGNLYMLTGKSYLSADSLVQAEKFLLKSIERYPDQFLTHFYLGITYNRLHQYEKSINILSTYLKKYRADKNAKLWIADSYYKQGILNMNNRQYAEAMVNFQKCREIKNDHSSTMQLVYCLNRLDRLTSADSLITKSVNAGIVDKKKVYYQQGYDLRTIAYTLDEKQRSQKYFKESARNLARHIDINPEDNYATWLLGNTYIFISEFNKGIKYLKEVSKKEPDNIDFKMDLAEVLIMTGHAEDVQVILPDSLIVARQKRFPESTLLLVTYLKFSANLVLSDEGKAMPDIQPVLMKKLDRAIEGNQQLSSWSYDAFKNWLSTYEGKSKASIESYTLKLEKQTQ